MRRPSLATIASYGTVLGVNAAEGVTQLLIPPYLEQRDYPIALIGFLFALPYGVALVCRVPAGLVYRASRARLLVGGAAVLAALVALLYAHAPGPLAFGALRAAQGVALAVVTTVTLAHFMATVASGAARGRAMGYYVSVLSAGFMTGGAIGGPIAQRGGYETGLAGAAVLALRTAGPGYLAPPPPEGRSPPGRATRGPGRPAPGPGRSGAALRLRRGVPAHLHVPRARHFLPALWPQRRDRPRRDRLHPRRVRLRQHDGARHQRPRARPRRGAAG